MSLIVFVKLADSDCAEFAAVLAVRSAVTNPR
jgi:hypothetical protein